jgi:hypothetical protein
MATLLLCAAAGTAAHSQQPAPLSVLQAPLESVSPARIRSLAGASACHAWVCDQALSLAVDVAPAARWRLAAEVTAGRSMLAGSDGRLSDHRVDLVYGPARHAVWVGFGRATENLAGVSTGLSRFEYGAAARWRSVSVDASVGTGAAPTLIAGASRIETNVYTRLDSLTGGIRQDTVRRTVTDSATPGRARWSSTALRIGWTAERWSVGGMVGRLVVRENRRPLWGGVDGSRVLGRRLTLLARAGSFVGPITSAQSAPRFAISAGLSAHTSWFSTAPIESPAAHGASAFDVRGLGGERYRLTIRAPGAARVEIASDVTAWQPIPMRRLRDDLWAVELSLAAGVHQVSLRTDGGSWIAPAGLIPVDDDFGGSAGAFVIR